MILWLLSCQGPEPTDSVEPVVEVLEPLDAPKLLRRLSIDLRGTLPTIEELDAVEADPTRIDAYRDEMLLDARLEDRLVRLLNERWNMRRDVYDAVWWDFGLEPEDEYEFERSLAEEPMRLVARVIAEDRPYTEIVTADWTMANPLLGDIWPVDYPEGETGWQPVQWQDGRPAAGALSSNGMWWVYYTTPFNQNRLRASAVFRLFICEDYLIRPIEVSAATLVNSDIDPTELIRTDPYCTACHSTIEPVAASLYGFFWTTQNSAAEMTYYHAERELLGEEELGVTPSWFGTEVSGLEELGARIGEDPRFEQCAVDTWASLLLRRDLTLDDWTLEKELRVIYRDAESRMHPVLTAITDTPEYRAAAVVEGTDRHLTTRTLMPDQLDSILNDLGGFEWTYYNYPQLDNDTTGHRVLAGGVDGYYVARPIHDPTLTWSLVVQRSAELTATALVEDDLFPSEPSADDLAELHWRLYAERPTDAWVQDATALWDTVEASEGSEEATRALLSGMLRSPRMVTY
ncbi:MAG: DUF1592 domain-containing protein [Proteobacteria bacterium]|nr:DUF1592 domain-containing protein [Pseudomonadota bacterium]MCP4921506.1 DUF1592 domain-containing protein [Pseudomonadota bacterium]